MEAVEAVEAARRSTVFPLEALAAAAVEEEEAAAAAAAVVDHGGGQE